MNTLWPNGVKITDEGNIFEKFKVYIFLIVRLTKHFPINLQLFVLYELSYLNLEQLNKSIISYF